MAEMAEEEERVIWEEEEEVLAGQISPVHSFWVEILLIPSNFFGASSEYPSRQKW